MNIIVKNNKVNIPREIIEVCGGNEIAARLLFNRGINTYEKALSVVNLEKYIPYNPNEFPNMDKAVNIIRDSVESGKKIAVYGDYDVDGVTATTILVSALTKLHADTCYHVPDRFTEGYGMNLDVVEELYKNGVSTIVTCDCGIANFKEIDRAKELGMEVVLTDHHTIGETLPNADVVINPKLLKDTHPAKHISGCATAYYVVKALFDVYNRDDADDYLDLVALSLIADVVPLIDESRYLLKKGLPLITGKTRIGMEALLEVVGSEIKNEEDVAFQIAPRINAAGRMDSARVPVEMFLSDNYDEALSLATQINAYNIDRKAIQKAIFEMADEQAKNEKRNKKILVLYGDSWHHGIIGIVAGRICELYKKPCIMLTLNEDGESIVGSARSTENINIYEVLSKHSDFLIKFGGHSGAAGLSLSKEKLIDFTKAIENYADIYMPEEVEENIFVDMKLDIADIKEDILQAMDMLAPFGEGFLAPVFCSKKVMVTADRIHAAGHHFMTFEDELHTRINAVLWNGEQESVLNKNLDVVYAIYKDTFNGNDEIKLRVIDFCESSGKEETYDFEVVNRKGRDIGEVVGEFRGATIFFEGATAYKPNLPTASLDKLSESDYVILYSLPKDKKTFNMIQEKTKARFIIENYSYIPDYSINGFSKLFIGLVKNIVNYHNGNTDIAKLATSLNVDKDFVITMARLMKCYGYIDFECASDIITFRFNNSEKKENNNLTNQSNEGFKSGDTKPCCTHNKNLEKVVARYLEEKAEYVKYMLK